MKKILFKTFIFGLGAVFLFTVSGCGDSDIENEVGEEELATIAKCLRDNGVVLYSSVGCPACKKQKEIFKDAFEYINHVECNAHVDIEGAKKCSEKAIRAVPSWELPDGEIITGLHQPEKIAEMAGCL